VTVHLIFRHSGRPFPPHLQGYRLIGINRDAVDDGKYAKIFRLTRKKNMSDGISAPHNGSLVIRIDAGI
jgi:hypothetical protein